jgi:hypothetical protein
MAVMVECNKRTLLATIKLVCGHRTALFNSLEKLRTFFPPSYFILFTSSVKKLYKFVHLRSSPLFIQQAERPKGEVEKAKNCRQGRK